MRELKGIYLGYKIKQKEEVFLCFDSEQGCEEEGLYRIKARYGNRMFFSTGYKTRDIDSIMLLRWKNDANGPSYEMRKPKLCKDGDLIRIDLVKEFIAMGLEPNEPYEKAKRGGGCSHFYDYGNWIYIGEYGYYQIEHDNWEENHANFYFAYPGLKIGNSLISKIEIDTFDSVTGEKMEPMYHFIRTVMDDLSAVNRYTKDELIELFTKHFPVTMYINIACKDKSLIANINHTGEPQRGFLKKNIVDGVRDYNTKWIKIEKPLELVVKELGL